MSRITPRQIRDFLQQRVDVTELCRPAHSPSIPVGVELTDDNTVSMGIYLKDVLPANLSLIEATFPSDRGERINPAMPASMQQSIYQSRIIGEELIGTIEILEKLAAGEAMDSFRRLGLEKSVESIAAIRRIEEECIPLDEDQHAEIVKNFLGETGEDYSPEADAHVRRLFSAKKGDIVILEELESLLHELVPIQKKSLE